MSCPTVPPGSCGTSPPGLRGTPLWRVNLRLLGNGAPPPRLRSQHQALPSPLRPCPDSPDPPRLAESPVPSSTPTRTTPPSTPHCPAALWWPCRWIPATQGCECRPHSPAAEGPRSSSPPPTLAPGTAGGASLRARARRICGPGQAATRQGAALPAATPFRTGCSHACGSRRIPAAPRVRSGKCPFVGTPPCWPHWMRSAPAWGRAA